MQNFGDFVPLFFIFSGLLVMILMIFFGKER